jgi:hypothetical protein
MKGSYRIPHPDFFSDPQISKGDRILLEEEYDGGAEMEYADLVAGLDRNMLFVVKKEFMPAPDEPVRSDVEV